MNRIYAPNFGKRPTAGLRRFCCMLAVFFGIFQVPVGPAKADPITVNRVVQTLKTVQGTTDLHLTLIAQDPLPTGTKTTAPTTGAGTGIGSNDPKLDALLSGFPIVPPSVDLGVDDFPEEGEVDGTICDCGEILIAGGGFPKWPLLFLAAVPIAFVPKDTDSGPTPTPTPTPPPPPSPTPTPTPEPASLLIFGTGLVAVGAGLRRRYSRTKLANQIQKTEEDQS